MLFRSLILGFVSVSVYKAKTVKAVKTSINVSILSYEVCALLWYAKKEKCLNERSMFTCTKIFFPSLPNLGAQIRCTQNY